MLQTRQRMDTQGFVLLVLLCASWGINQVAIKVAIPTVPPVLQAGIRSIGSSILVLMWMRFKHIPLKEKDGTLFWGILVGLLFTVEFILIYWGLEFTHASRSAVFLNTAPFTVALGAQFFIPGERLRPVQVAGLVLAFCGIIAAFHESLSLPTRQMLLGDSMLLAAAVIWGATTVVIKASPLARIAPSKTLLYQLGCSAVLLPLASVILKEPGIGALNILSVTSLLYQIIWVAFITYIGWFWLISRYPVSRMASFTFLTPLFGVMAGGVLLGEPMTFKLITALVLVGSGIYLVNRK
ncbi:MAG: DMT family transporter [Desulfobacteraceae bacterium]|nr:MAG: DMT family transporter [Desulfobacteraceae bacterium]